MLTGENHVCLPCICMGDKYHAPNPTPSPACVNHAACLRAIPQLIPSIPSFNFLAHSLILFCMQLLSWSINHSLVVPTHTPLEVFSIRFGRVWRGVWHGFSWRLSDLDRRRWRLRARRGRRRRGGGISSFVPQVAALPLVLVDTAYAYAKQGTGPLRPEVNHIEGTVKDVVGPIYNRFHIVPLDILKLIYRKVKRRRR